MIFHLCQATGPQIPVPPRRLAASGLGRVQRYNTAMAAMRTGTIRIVETTGMPSSTADSILEHVSTLDYLHPSDGSEATLARGRCARASGVTSSSLAPECTARPVTAQSKPSGGTTTDPFGPASVQVSLVSRASAGNPWRSSCVIPHKSRRQQRGDEGGRT